DLDRLTHERATLRDRLFASPIGDAQRYTSTVEETYRSLWRRWCNEQSAPRGQRPGNRRGKVSLSWRANRQRLSIVNQAHHATGYQKQKSRKDAEEVTG